MALFLNRHGITGLELGDDKLPAYAVGLKSGFRPDFACPIYPGIHPDFLKAAEARTSLPPMFLVNGAEDTLTPARDLVDLMSILLRKGVRAELHVYTKGGHGFDSGVERGHSVAGWRIWAG